MKQIILLAVLLSLSIIGWTISARYKGEFGGQSGWTLTLIVLTIAFAIALAGALINIEVSRANTRSDIREFEAFRTTINQQRTMGVSDLEKVQLSQKIIEQNQWLAKHQFWATNPWTDIFYDKSILNIKPIE